MPNNTLVVPVEVAALAVNAQTRDTDGTYVIQRWQANFRSLTEDNQPPEPLPFQGTEIWRDKPERLGVYLQWQLPEALCQGHQDSESGEIGDFPLVPNRWLVVRRSNRAMTSWVVESDYLDPQNGAVSYLDPDAATPTATKAGRRHDLTVQAPWREPADAREPFLTALGPGLLTFSVYQPYNLNVFSIHDTLADIEGDDRLSYYVTGWYSQESKDILAGTEDYTHLLDRLHWSLPPGMGSPRHSLYTGTALGIDWKPNGGIPVSDCPGPAKIAVAIGNSAAEAAAVLQEQAAGPGSLNADDARLYRAFLLGVLDELDRSDGDLFPERTAHQGGFGPVPGGYTWRVVDRGDPNALPPLSAGERTRQLRLEQDVTAGLNTKQADLDDLERKLAGAQEHLYNVWSLAQEKKQPDFFARRSAAELNPANPDGAAGKVADLAAQLRDRRTEIPWANDPDTLAERARAYAADQGLRGARVLQRVPLDPYEQHADPVIMLQGANLNAPMTRGSRLPCRTEERLVTAVGSITALSVAADVAKVNTAHLPEAVPALVTEFCILDQARKTGANLNAATGTLPALGTDPWRQPWQPLYLMWRAEYTAIPYQANNGTAHWSFDGNRYRWKGTGDLTYAVTAGGRQTLAPTSGHDQDGKLAGYAAGRGDLPDELIQQLRQQARSLDQLSQRLDGLSAEVAQREARTTLRPTGAIRGLIGDADRQAPDPGPQPVFEWDDWEPTDFQELRSGHLAFAALSVVDRFGRAVNLIDNPQHFRPFRPQTMVPDHFVGEMDRDRYIELGPRLLQPARLHFDFLSAQRDEPVDLTPGTNPVCAWLLHNRLDKSIACYGPEGHALGDLRTVLSANGQRIVAWTALPGSDIQELDQLAALSPHAHRFLAAIQQRGPAVLDAVRAHLDAALATIDPDGPADESLAFLLGRPLALVRARLDLELSGPPRTDVTWKNVLNPPQPKMPHYQWTVRLGEARQTDDGLIGYVLDNDYTHFETVITPSGDSAGYLRPIDKGQRLQLAFNSASTALVTLLLDPRAAVHATTDILPVTAIHLPQEFTTHALANMAVSFRAGPLLAATTNDGAALLPHPATATGTWTWTERAADAWASMPITVPDPTGLPIGQDPQIRSGFLVLDEAAAVTRHEEAH
ncbi:hypothetical protein ACFV6D_29925 [Kitasatospora sp. NPDC059812]|uniref:hypothetical protein n=1 Tax=Kitasatospora sp. NPDC059812 TaxID=3346958 RepID=UPI003660B261